MVPGGACPYLTKETRCRCRRHLCAGSGLLLHRSSSGIHPALVRSRYVCQNREEYLLSNFLYESSCSYLDFTGKVARGVASRGTGNPARRRGKWTEACRGVLCLLPAGKHLAGGELARRGP